MLKQVKTAQLYKQRLIPHQIQAIKTNQFVIGPDNKIQARKGMLDVYGQDDGHLGVVKMNREHRYNTLTPSLISEIIRGVDTFDNDDLKHLIYLSTEKGEQWSNGTDFRTIAHMKKEDNFGRIQEYMRQIYLLQTHIASLNKPLIAVAPGHAYNSGATFLAACGHPMTTPDAKVAFNETSFGFVPHAGGTYYMSRMKGEFGTFMALTSLPILGSEATKIDISRGCVHNTEEYSQEVSTHANQLPFPMYGGRRIFQRSKGQPQYTAWQQHKRRREAVIHQLSQKEQNQLITQQGFGLDNVYREPSERSSSSIAEANYNYMKYLRNDSKKLDPEEMGYLEMHRDGAGNRRNSFRYLNYYEQTMGFVTSRIGHPFGQLAGQAVHNEMLIDRCFYSNNVQEIMENLKKESHPFATQCLQAMQRNSPQSMQLALLMLRKAQNLCYRGCLEMELNVAFNRFKDADFDLGVNSVLFTPKIQGQKHKTTPKWGPFLKQQELDRYFEPNDFAKGVDIKAVESALLPTKHYYKRYSDQVRLWINETSSTSETVRDKFDQEAREALHELGVDARDLAVSPDTVRNHLRAQLAQEKVLSVQNERAEQLMTDQKLRENYFEQINKELMKLETDKDYFYKEVNKNVNDVFENAFLERLDHVYRKSQEAHNLEKRRMIIRMKKFLFKERILTYDNETVARHTAQTKALPFQQIHLKEKWDQCFREMQHPDLVKTPLHYISKALGRVSLTAPELAKVYLTQPENREMMTAFTIDKSELEKLQTDVLTNPEKYEMIFTGHSNEEFEDKDFLTMRKRTNALQQEKMDEHEYWFRMINEGRCPLDSLPFAQEFNQYKAWADLIEHNAVNTLRAAINKLLLDYENVEAYEGSLAKLFTKINSGYLPKSTKTEQKKGKSMGVQTRPVQEIRQSIQMMLKNDAFLGHIYGDHKLQSNKRVTAMKNEFESELLRLVEIVLLNKDQKTQNRDLLEKRLASLTNPQQEIGISLNIIDQFLHKKNGEALVKDAFTLVAPFFQEMMQKKIEVEIQNLFDEIRMQEIGSQIIVYYFLNKTYPYMHRNQTLHKFLNYSFDEEIQQLMNDSFPFLSENFRRRELQAILGGEDLQTRPGSTLAEMKHDSIEQTRKELEDFKQFNLKLNQKPNYEVSSQEVKEKNFKMSDFEYRELAQIENHLSELDDFLYDFKYEIDTHMTNNDALYWLTSVIENGLDMNALQQSLPNPKEGKFYWEQISDYAKFLHYLTDGLHKTGNQHKFDGIDFMKNFNSKSAQQEHFYESAKRERDNQLRNIDVVDRSPIIKRQIKDFNEMKEFLKEKRQYSEHVQKQIDLKPQEIQVKLREFLNDQEIINTEKFCQHIQKDNYQFLERPHLVVDYQLAIKEAKKSITRLDSKIDVVSLMNLKQQIVKDVLLKKSDRKNLGIILDYVMEQTKYMSNEDRKNLTVKDYIEKFHFNSHDAYTQYASDLLKSKLQEVLGEPVKETKFIEWQVAQSRTMPSAHFEPEKSIQVEPDQDLTADLLETIQKYTEKQVVCYNFYRNKKEDNNEEIALKKKIQSLSVEFQSSDKSEPTTPDQLNETQTQIEEQILIWQDKQQQNIVEIENLLLDSNLKSIQSQVYAQKGQQINCDIPVEIQNQDLGVKETGTLSEMQNLLVYREAKKLCELPDTMRSVKNLYENQMIVTLLETDFEGVVLNKANDIIEEYTNLRINGMLLNKNFAQEVQKENSHIFMKVLREHVIEELGLHSKPEAHELSYQNINKEFGRQQFFELENKYNMNDVNGLNSIGYDNLLERARAQTAEDQFNVAHDSVFDKLLTDYFLSKRGEHKESNKLLNQLNEVFAQQNSKSLEQTFLLQNAGKVRQPTLQPGNFREMIQLDVLSQRAMQKEKNGLSERLRSLSIKETDHPDFKSTQVPEYFEVFDVRKPASLYVTDKLMMVIYEYFQIRAEMEKRMTRAELIAFDKVLARYLQIEKLLPRLKESIQEDYNALHQGRPQVYHHKDNLRENLEVQHMKVTHEQRNFNKLIKDENAEIKAIAFMTGIDKKNQQEAAEERDYTGQFVSNNFEHYYLQQLKKDAKKPPRPIDMDQFKSRKSWDRPIGKPYLSREEKVKDIWVDHKLYQEKKLEQQDRMRLFYILEQFYEQARTQKDPTSEGQKLISEYFSIPENTFFLDKNKIV